MKSINLKDIFYGIVAITCVVLYSYLTRFEVVMNSQGFIPVKYDRMTGKSQYFTRGNGLWNVMDEPKN